MTTKFNAGDRVRCVIGSRQYNLVAGKTYTVDDTSLDRVMIKDNWLYSNRFIKEEEVKFKVGDQVQCIRESEILEIDNGSVYTVTSEADRFGEIKVDGKHWSILADRFVLVKVQESVPVPVEVKTHEVFQSGDIVKCVDNDGAIHFNIDKYYTIAHVKNYCGEVDGLIEIFGFAGAYWKRRFVLVSKKVHEPIIDIEFQKRVLEKENNKGIQMFTPWFIDGEKPVRVGVYQVSCQREDQSGRWHAYWNGVKFCYLCESVEVAFINKDCDSIAGDKILTSGSWRGFSSEQIS